MAISCPVAGLANAVRISSASTGSSRSVSFAIVALLPCQKIDVHAVAESVQVFGNHRALPPRKTTARVPGNLFSQSFAQAVRLFPHDVLRHPQDHEVALAGLFLSRRTRPRKTRRAGHVKQSCRLLLLVEAHARRRLR